MRVKVFVFLLISCVFLFACHDDPAREKQVAAGKSNTEYFIDFSRIDSVEFIFYPNIDSQHHYRHTMITEVDLLKQLQEALSAPPVEKKPCAHPIKLYLFKKGAVYKTVYVSMVDSCQYLAYANNSNQVFVEMNSSLLQTIKEITTSLE